MLKGKNALVTGSTSGIGLAIAGTLAAGGANVTLNGLGEPAEIEAIRADLAAAFGVEAHYSPADMTKPAEIVAMVEDVAARGGIDILVNNAGIQHVAPVEEFPVDQWDRIIAVNLSAAFHATRAAVPHMKARRWGRIINTASAHALTASPYKAAYVAAKHGIAGLTKTVALEVATFGITVNAIAPAYVWTPLVESQIPDTARSRGISEEAVKRDVMLGAQPTKQFIQVEEIGSLAAYLCTDMARSITGAILPIDGGWTAQ